MTDETLQKILSALELEYESEPTLIYVFYRTPDGRVDNLSISFRHGKGMSDEQLQQLMHREYPATRGTTTVAVDRPDWVPPVEWLDVPDVVNLLHISLRTLRSWTSKGIFHPSQIGRKLYYSRDEVEDVLRRNAVMDNGRFDKSAFMQQKATKCNKRQQEEDLGLAP